MAYRKLENFRITKKLEQKFCYTVYEAVDKSSDEPICLKLLDPELNDDKELVFNFINGARVAKKLDNPNILKILSYGTDENFHFIASEPIEYQPLTALISDDFALSLQDLIRIFSGIAQTLRYAHLNGLIHGVLNPKSIHVNADCDVKIDDFGFNWLIPQVLQRDTKEARYLAQYIAPEYYKTPELIDGQGDIYALGMILYEMLNGSAPFQGEALAAIQVQHLKGRFPRLNYADMNLPDAIGNVLQNSVSRFKEQRYSNLNQFLDALGELKQKYVDVPEALEDKPSAKSKSASRSVPIPGPSDKPSVRKAVFGGAVLLVLLVAIIFGINRFTAESPPAVSERESQAQQETHAEITNGRPEPTETNGTPTVDSLSTVEGETEDPGESSTEGRNGAIPDVEKVVSRPPEPPVDEQPETRTTAPSEERSPEPARVTMVVTSNEIPVEANIFLDDRFIGKTDRNGRLLLGDLEQGKSYSARVVKDGYTAVSKNFTPGSSTSSINFDIEPKQNIFGILILDAVPNVDSVYVDGKFYRRSTPIELRLPWGEHKVRFVNSELNEVWEQTVELKAGQVMRLKHDFTQVEYGKVAVSLTNAHQFGFGYVYVDSELWEDKHNTTPIELKLPVGVHTIAVKREGFSANPEEVRIKIDKNTTKRVSFTFTKSEGTN